MLKEQIKNDLKTALKEKNETKISVIRMMISAINNKEIELRKKETGLEDEEITAVIRTEIKKRKDAIEAFASGGRPELAENEKSELEILRDYLPPELPDEEIEKTVKAVIEELQASSQKDFGKVMKEVMARLKGQVAGDRISAAVKKFLQLQ